MIPYGRQDISHQDIDAVVDVLKSDFLTQGPKVPLFEKTVSKKVGVEHAVAVNSATSALHVACLALGLGKGDWLWTSPNTFVASANCGLYCGAKVDFVDIDPITYNLCPKALEEKLIQAKQQDRLPKIVVPVHLCGQPCDMKSIHRLSKKYGFKIIEDASHAIGGKYLSSPIGSCRYSDITVFSFHPVKIITTAEGGLATTNQSDLAKKMDLFRTHGITRDTSLMTHTLEGPWYYEQIELGYNYRMTDLQAALGISQMTRLDEYIEKRNALAERYKRELDGLNLKCQFVPKNIRSAYHLFVIRLQQNSTTDTRHKVFLDLRKNGINVNVHYIPIHLQPYYKSMGFKYGDFPQSESYYEQAITLPLYPGLDHAQQDHIVNSLKESLKRHQ